MHITVNENYTAALLDDEESPTKMIQFPAYNLSTLKEITSSSEAEEQADSYIPRFEKISVDYISPETQAEQRAAADLKNNEDMVRNSRNMKLTESDWMGLSDNAMTEEWVEYRQSLRDITANENFPTLEESDWPVEPS